MMPGHAAGPLRSGGSGRTGRRRQTRAERWDETSPSPRWSLCATNRIRVPTCLSLYVFPRRDDAVSFSSPHLLISSARLRKGSGKRQKDRGLGVRVAGVSDLTAVTVRSGPGRSRAHDAPDLTMGRPLFMLSALALMNQHKTQISLSYHQLFQLL